MRVALLVAVGASLAGASLPAAASGGLSLGAAKDYAVLGGSNVDSAGATVLTGSLGVSPGTSITGFPPGIVTGGAIHAGDADAAEAHADASAAYTLLQGMSSPPANNLTGLDLGGQTLSPGVYAFNSSAQLTGELTLDAHGNPDARFVFQVASTLTTAIGASVVVVNGGPDYDESKVFWQVGSSATLGADTSFTGNILAFASITMVAGSSLTGSALALNGAVTLESNRIDASHRAGGSARHSGGRTRLDPPGGAEDHGPFALIEVKHSTARGPRPERSRFKMKVRRLEDSTGYTLWADDPSTPENDLVQFDSFTTGHRGQFNYGKDTGKGDEMPFGAPLADLSGMAVEVRDSSGTTTLLGGGVSAGVGAGPSGVLLLIAAVAGPSLGGARSFAVLGGSTVANTGATTAIDGDVGVSPGTSITGLTAGQVTGGIFVSGVDAEADQAHDDAAAAYASLAVLTPDTDLTGTNLGGLTLTPGVYNFDTTAQLTGTLTLDARCDSGAVFVFQIGSTLTTAASAKVVVINGGADYDESNLFWQVGTSATLGSSTVFLGIILADQSIAIGTSSTLTGSALAINAAVTTDSNTITSPPVVVDTSTLVLTPYWGHVTDAQASGADSTKIRMTYTYSASPDGELHPDSEEMTVVVLAEGETTPLTVVILANDAGWIVSGDEWYWGKVVGGVDWRVRVNDVTHFIEVYAGGFDFSPGDGTGADWGGDWSTFPVSLSITVGNDAGIDARCWRNSMVFNSTRNWAVLRIP